MAISVCILKAKSKTLAPFGRLITSPRGVNTNISVVNKLSLRLSIKVKAVELSSDK